MGFHDQKGRPLLHWGGSTGQGRSGCCADEDRVAVALGAAQGEGEHETEVSFNYGIATTPGIATSGSRRPASTPA